MTYLGVMARGSCEWSWTRREYLHQGDDFGFGKRRASAGLGRVGDEVIFDKRICDQSVLEWLIGHFSKTV